MTTRRLTSTDAPPSGDPIRGSSKANDDAPHLTREQQRQRRGYAARVVDLTSDALGAKLRLDLGAPLPDVVTLLRRAADAAVRIAEDLEEVTARDR